MKAFVSYSHRDSEMLDRLHKHLSQLRREGLIETWTDHDISAGGSIDRSIDAALSKAQLFIALATPDYIASKYCYDKEFQQALSLEKLGQLSIVPIILEPCDWEHTPLRDFKALPKDGKPISTWQNINTAFVDVAQNLRKLIEEGNAPVVKNTSVPQAALSKNYRVKKDFDSIEKLEFVEHSFAEVGQFLKVYLEEITTLDNIKSKVIRDEAQILDILLVNRNKINTESLLHLHITSPSQFSGFARSEEKSLSFSLQQNGRHHEKAFQLAFDDYHLFWTEQDFYRSKTTAYDSRDIADLIWQKWLESVGIDV